MNPETLKKNLPVIVAVAIALVGALIYFASGRSSMDSNVRQLEKGTAVDHVETKGNSVIVKCKNGESYQIIYKEGQTNFQDLVYNKCGDEGVAETQQN